MEPQKQSERNTLVLIILSQFNQLTVKAVGVSTTHVNVIICGDLLMINSQSTFRRSAPSQAEDKAEPVF